MTVERVQRMAVAGRTLATGLLGGAAAGAASAVLVIVVAVLTGGEGAEGVGDWVERILLLIPASVQVGLIGALIGLAAGLVVAVPAAAVMALAAPLLAARPTRARAVCAAVVLAAAVALEAAVLAATGGGVTDSPWTDVMIVSPALAAAGVLGWRRGPALVDGPAGRGEGGRPVMGTGEGGHGAIEAGEGPGGPDPVTKAGYVLEFEDLFEGDRLNEGRWMPYYLPQWNGRAASAARYEVGGGRLDLLIEEDQPPWYPEREGGLRVSSLQTGVFAGPLGSTVGQHGRGSGMAVREEQRAVRLYTPQYGLIELRARAIDDPRSMVALWMIGYEDEPERSAEICVCEIFGRDVGPDTVRVGMGLHPFGDPAITDDFTVETLPIDAREFHVYAAEWTPERVSFLVDGRHVRTVRQSPRYPMQLMLNIYEFPEAPERDTPPAPEHPYPKRFTVDYVRGYRPTARAGSHVRSDLPAAGAEGAKAEEVVAEGAGDV
ncbi:glycoside hydrolase family 16 protein [Planomonospora parontospora]|nr:glycoside hydrolase family 16 protein [Planomonospora parontospora]